MDKYQIRAVMSSIPTCVKLAGKVRVYGNPAYNVLYGYYKLDGRFLSKLKMKMKNG